MKAEPDKTHVARELVHKHPLIGCRFLNGSPYVFAGSEDNTAVRFDLETGKSVVLAGHDSWVFALAPHPRDGSIVTGGGDGKIIWWSAASPKPEAFRTLTAHQGWVRTLAISPDGSIVASAGNDRVIRLWSHANGKPIMELPGHDRPVYKLLFNPAGTTLISADLRGLVIEWDYKPGKEARRLDASKLYEYNTSQGVDYGGVRDLASSADFRYLACGGLIEASNPLGAISNPAIVLLDGRSGQHLRLMRPRENVLGLITGLRFHPDGFLIASSGGNAGGFLWFFNLNQSHEFIKIALGNTARDMDLHSDGLQIATAHHDGKIRISRMGAKSK
jgi:WD40 repeat protein